MPSGRKLTLFLVDGSARGVITAEIGNWSGMALAAPRGALPELVKRKEIESPGMYILVGPDPDMPSRKRVYVGESENLRTRLVEHEREKDFFTDVYVLVSKDRNLTKSHVRYLEALTINRITSTRRAELDNEQRPAPSNLPEADTADMDRYLQEVDVILPVLGFDVLRPAAKTDALAGAGTSPIFELTGTTEISARAQEIDGEFILLSGSQLRKQEAASLPAGIVEQRRRLIEAEDAIEDQGGKNYKLIRDIPCTSPSQAANLANGYKVKSRDVWRSAGEDKINYGDWRAKQFGMISKSN